jgi:prepilin-type N-terminal cleavage/methylation domain-containing protein
MESAMSKPIRKRSQAGFTLVELMVVTGIIGILASVAIPNYQKFTLRSKTAERVTIMYRIKQQIQDFYVRNGTSIDPVAHPGLTSMDSMYNPEFPPVAQRRQMESSVALKPIWAEYFHATATTASVKSEIEGSLYYSYYFRVEEGPANRITVWAAGDLDSDGTVSWKTTTWTRQNGVYQITSDSPAVGQEDDNSIYRSF